MSKQTQSFQAEVKQLLHLVTHSLYSNKEIFLRELVSNASDACDKLRFEAIDKPALYEDQPDLQIRLSIDKDARTLTITDNGIGMSFEEAASNLGTIAKSGTREFISQLEGDQKKDANLIGQFGVGFYSGFIVADRITVESRRAGLNAEDGVRWQSEGAGEFEIENISREQRGTSVTLHLREGEDEWLEPWKVRQIISRYSDHISLPILMRQQEWDKDKGEYIEQDAWEPVNQANALWTRSKNEIGDEQYIEFYKQISWDSEAPLAWTHNRVEGKTEYTQLLYIPSHAPMDMWNRDSKAGVKLYVKRIFIMDDAQQLLPNYLRFVKGVIDSADLPLNVSRELLQDSRDVRMIRDGSTKRVLSLLEDMADSEDTAKQEKYQTFWHEFGSVLKEGVGEDNNNRERIAKLLRFASTQSDAQTVSLADYVARMQDGQKAIYYVTADTLATAKNSPQLEIFNAKGIEVLLLTDRVDEWMLSFLQEFDGKPLQSVAKGTADLGDLQNEEEKKQAQDAGNDLRPVLEKIKNVLQERVSEVRVTTRLVSSPACVVVSEGALSSHLTRLLQQAGQEVPQTQPILEINPQHALVKKLAAFNEENADQFSDLANVIFDQAVLAEGGALENPAAYVQRVNRLLM
ncbi:molecular chaperone HtpG [Saezia sanguinis]|uniref:molecular chaperone HtpG n=1 Tax=Saezia sanguinis TaxID=1965230 RepID=UPI003068C271